MNRIKRNDEVIVIAGKDKGRRGTVIRINDEDDTVLVEGVNIVKKHQKGNPNAGVQGGIIDEARAIHISNVMLFNPVSGKGDRVGVKTLEDGRKVRFFKSDNEVVDV
ncbi:MAG: 50S ribosomal protein L24 [Gammaproteobacteria bacterium]|nr:50S ribosomal protein L24 [Gammaproteobacteria bacterium]MCP4089137.1 50S ribosomal protein L24 [Gammaproteobacteria bacterium]MCP4276839.1 50S ribosomal protein L24 [Gammaproteobacteria bacterium]MCP4830682.1 50S ribosomal protein L24 [Gammaproteobacteria bacterium]MCP4928491.1 50S ribosomal protein L24 [Gammaproteobacteria bacterium]